MPFRLCASTWGADLYKSLLILLCLLCVAATPVPPKPRLKQKVQSPKGAEFTASLVKVTSLAMPLVYIPSLRTLKWDWPTAGVFIPDPSVWFIIRSTTNLTTSPDTWTQRALTPTNYWTFPTALNYEFFRAWATNIVTGQISE